MSNFLLITPLVSEPVLPESLRPEVINVEKWEQPSPRPQHIMDIYFRHILNDIADVPVLETLFRTDFLEGWYSPEVRPVRLPARPRPLDYVEDITPFADIFRTDFLEGWYQPTIKAIPLPARIYPLGYQEDITFFSDLFPAAAITLDNWYQPAILPLRLTPRLDRPGYTEEIVHFKDLFRADFLEGWFNQEIRPVWDLRGPNKSWLSDLVQFSDLFPLVITIDTWDLQVTRPIPPMVLYHKERFATLTQFEELFPIVTIGVVALTLRVRSIDLALGTDRAIALALPTRSVDLTINTGI